MNVSINTTLLTEQRELIGRLVANLESGRTGFAITRDLPALLGITGILDAINDKNDLDCCGECSECSPYSPPGDCDSCMYQYDGDIDPVCDHAIDVWRCPICEDEVQVESDYNDIPFCPDCECERYPV